MGLSTTWPLGSLESCHEVKWRATVIAPVGSWEYALNVLSLTPATKTNYVTTLGSRPVPGFPLDDVHFNNREDMVSFSKAPKALCLADLIPDASYLQRCNQQSCVEIDDSLVSNIAQEDLVSSLTWSP